MRIVIAHAIDGIKRSNILAQTFRNRTEHFEDDVIGVCAGLWNLVPYLLRNNSNVGEV
jgi:hypothetical protein